MTVNNSNHLSSQALACYEIPDSQGANHWDSLPDDTIFKIFNFVLSGRSESPSPNALLRLIRLNYKTVCFISFISKAFSLRFSNYSNKIGGITNEEDVGTWAWKQELKANRPDMLSIRTLHDNLQFAKEMISYWNKVGEKPTNKNERWTSENCQKDKDMVQNGLNGAAELSAYGLLSYEQVMDLISSLPTEMKESTYSDICHKFLKMKLFPLVVRLIQENFITNKDTLREITQGILSNIKFLADDLDQDVITFIHYEIMYENLSKIFPFTDHFTTRIFHDVLNYALEKGFFQDNNELIQEFIEKNSPENSVGLEKSFDKRAWLEKIFFKNLVKRHLFDQALEFAHAYKVKSNTIAISLIREKQYKLAFNFISTLDNIQVNEFVFALLNDYWDLDDLNPCCSDWCFHFLPIMLKHQKEKINKLNPLKLKVVIKLFQRADMSRLLQHFDWQVVGDEREFIKSISLGWESRQEKLLEMLIFLVERMKIKFNPCILVDLLSVERGQRREGGCSITTERAGFLVRLYRLLCDTTLNPSRKESFKMILPAFFSEPSSIQEFENISAEHAALVQEIRLSMDMDEKGTEGCVEIHLSKQKKERRCSVM